MARIWLAYLILVAVLSMAAQAQEIPGLFGFRLAMTVADAKDACMSLTGVWLHIPRSSLKKLARKIRAHGDTFVCQAPVVRADATGLFSPQFVLFDVVAGLVRSVYAYWPNDDAHRVNKRVYSNFCDLDVLDLKKDIVGCRSKDWSLTLLSGTNESSAYLSRLPL